MTFYQKLSQLVTIKFGWLRRVAWADLNAIRKSPFFDWAWYAARNPDLPSGDLAKHYLLHGGFEGRDPGPEFSSQAYLRDNPDVAADKINPLLHYELYGKHEGRRVATAGVYAAIKARFPSLDPLRIYQQRDLPRRIVLLTDSINAGSLYGGVSTAIILTVLLAQRLDAQLVVTTRTEKPERGNVNQIISAHNLPKPRNIEFVHVGIDGGDALNIGPKDLIITTSWWTTASTLRSVSAERIIYILQEDERMFYPCGDEQLLCKEILSRSDLLYVINSQLLYGHFTGDGFKNLQNAVWFEPSFPKNHYFMEEKAAGPKLNFVFYARPNNLRNLYYRGLEAVDAAITKNIIDPDLWTINFMGKDLKGITLAKGIKPVVQQNMSWSEYTAFIRQADLGFSLMYTPHPSYPPLDFAACGAVAVTNRFAPKNSLANYSKNILTADLDVPSLLEALSEGAALARDREARFKNYQASGIGRDWRVSFEKAIEHIVRERGHVL
jgi:hypothetical protein